jgi:anti-anti-sigma regulatory factor
VKRIAFLSGTGAVMPVTLDQDEARCTLRIDGEATISISVSLKEHLVHALALEAPVYIDLNGITDVDITALQLFWAAHREAESLGKELTFSSPLPELILTTLQHADLKLPVAAA